MTASIVVFCVHGVGHFQTLLPVVERLCARGRTVHVMTHADFRARVERAGARFCDLFAAYPLEAADATSIPVPSRYVSFAGAYAERLTDDVAVLAPALIVYDTFMVVAPVIARRLDVPYVNVCPNHAPVPARVVAALRQDPRVATSAQCWEAVKRLRQVHGMSRANPFSYVEGLSPFLNLYCEPAEFLDEQDRDAFQPIAFFGSLAPALREANGVELFPRIRRSLRLYVSFGTVMWQYFEAVALAALGVISSACADLDVDVVIGLGGHPLQSAARAALLRPNVQVVDDAHQWSALRQADVFITHNGLNSTHEAIFHQVPMISYPFFGDQPALAGRCQALGLAVPLAGAPRAPLEPGTVRAAVERLTDGRDAFAARLAEARSWELRTIADRDVVVDRLLALSGTPLRGLFPDPC